MIHLVGRSATQTLVQAALEACCGAADLADELAQCAGWSVSLAHPGFVARMKQNPDKTDYSDARLLTKDRAAFTFSNPHMGYRQLRWTERSDRRMGISSPVLTP